MLVAQSLDQEAVASALPPPIAPAGGPSKEIPKINPVPRHASPLTGAGDGQSGGQPASEPESAVKWDRFFRAYVGELNCSLSAPGLALACLDWLLHLGFFPGKQWNLIAQALRDCLRFAVYAAGASLVPGTPPVVEPSPQDHRFSGPGVAAVALQPVLPIVPACAAMAAQRHDWGATAWPATMSRSSTSSPKQLLDIFAPTNFPWTNPKVLKATLEQGGSNLFRGTMNFLEDWARAVCGSKPAVTEPSRWEKRWPSLRARSSIAIGSWN